MMSAAKDIQKDIDDLATNLKNKSVRLFKFNEPEHIFKVECLMKHLGGPASVDP